MHIFIWLLVGAVAGQRLKVLALVPAMAIAIAVAVVSGIAGGESLLHVLAAIFAATTSLQVGYLVGISTRHFVAATNMHRLPRPPTADARAQVRLRD